MGFTPDLLLERKMLHSLMTMARKFLVPLLLLAGCSACGAGDVLPGTTVKDTPENRDIIETIEKYRERLVARNVEGLLVLAAPDYHEDGGTPSARDDYGYEGLKDVLKSRLVRVKSIRYEIQYKTVNVRGKR